MILVICEKNPDLFLYYSYDPGDVAVVCPQNMPDTVDDFIDYLKLDSDQHFTLTPNDPGSLNDFYIIFKIKRFKLPKGGSVTIDCGCLKHLILKF